MSRKQVGEACDIERDRVVQPQFTVEVLHGLIESFARSFDSESATHLTDIHSNRWILMLDTNHQTGQLLDRPIQLTVGVIQMVQSPTDEVPAGEDGCSGEQRFVNDARLPSRCEHSKKDRDAR